MSGRVCTHYVDLVWEDRSNRIQHDDPGYVWRQVADDLRKAILAENLPAGLRLPNAIELGEIYGVARGTVLRAIRELVDEGLLVVTPSRGTFVR